MSTMEAEYRSIETRDQYYDYCNKLEKLVDIHPKTKAIDSEIDQLTGLIEAWDEEHTTFNDTSEEE